MSENIVFPVAVSAGRRGHDAGGKRFSMDAAFVFGLNFTVAVPTRRDDISA
jgi:hypothetical protein